MVEKALIETAATDLIGQAASAQNPAIVYLASLSSIQSRRVMRQALDTIAAIASSGRLTMDTFNWSMLHFQHTTAIRSALTEKYAPATVNKMLSALRGVLKMAYRLGGMSPDDYARASDIAGIKGSTLPAGRELAAGEIFALVSVCKDDPSPAGARDAAMLGILYTCGLRRAELVALDLADYDPVSGRLTVRSGKGRKARTVYVTNGASAALQSWVVVRGTASGPLFVRVLKGGKLTDARLTTQAVYTILKSRATKAGVKDFTPHDMRRTFVSDMLDRGADIATVSKLAGHANVTTTARYDRRGEETKKKAAGLLHFPF